MKSRTLYCDKTVFRKDMTRFAPAWILYTICLVLGMSLIRQDYSGYGFHSNLGHLLPIMSVINLGYALLAAQLLFGDLYNSRLCNAIHALPVTRDALFLSHTVAGILWSVIPSLIGTALALVLGIDSEVEKGWQIALYWLLGTNLQYLFFFGVAALSALCVGNRFAQAVVYGIINFASILAFWLVDTLYVPMLYGVTADSESFTRFSPVVWFAGSEYIDMSREAANGEIIRAWFELSDGWGYLAICAVIGVGLLAAALALYRRRQLETAGDFMAVKALEPVFLVVYPLIVAAVFYCFCDEMLGIGGTAFAYMAIGLVIGFFTGQMLLERTIRVFNKKAFLKFAALAVGFGATLGITVMDPFGIVTWIPEGEDVAYVEVSPSLSRYYSYNVVTLDEPEDIDRILRVHEIALEGERFDGEFYYTIEEENGEVTHVNTQSLAIHYHLNNGTTKSRYYYVDLNGETGDILIPYFNTLEAIFQDYTGDHSFEGILKATQAIGVNCTSYNGDKYEFDKESYCVWITDPQDIRELMEAITADCELGVMAQNWDFRPSPDVSSTYWLNFDMVNQGESITVYSDCVNTNTWLAEHGFFSQELEELGGVTAHFISD